MALIDYYTCDVCGNKTLYDADIAYRWELVGDMKIICRKCAETHEVMVREKLTPRLKESEHG